MALPSRLSYTTGPLGTAALRSQHGDESPDHFLEVLSRYRTVAFSRSRRSSGVYFFIRSAGEEPRFFLVPWAVPQHPAGMALKISGSSRWLRRHDNSSRRAEGGSCSPCGTCSADESEALQIHESILRPG